MPPQGKLDILLDLVWRGNTQALQERAAHIEQPGEQSIPFAHTLHELATGFEERERMALVEHYMEGRR